MKIRNDSVHPPMPEVLEAQLQAFRAKRNFDAKKYISAKVELLEKYTSTYNLNAIVIGVSGGIDSAIVLALVAKIPQLNILPALLPAYGHNGVTGQDAATERGLELCKSLNLEPCEIDMAPLAETVGEAVHTTLSSIVGVSESAWGRGQLVPYVRTPVLYYLTTLLTDNGCKAFIGGTTNYSEGAYLGYIGKASDAMVDVQLISDLYKSEVFAVAKELGIPESILGVAPTGDMFDGTTDEDVFGASYDFVELYMEYLGCDPWERKTFESALDVESLAYFTTFADKLDAMHRYNKHKYLAGSPAVHLDINSPQTYEKFWKKTDWKG